MKVQSTRFACRVSSSNVCRNCIQPSKQNTVEMRKVQMKVYELSFRIGYAKIPCIIQRGLQIVA